MKRTSDYYDEFSARYERGRLRGYHAMIDDLEAGVVLPRASGKRVLEAGCGTGLIMERLRCVRPSLVGADLSQGMLRLAAARGFAVVRADIRALPFRDESFDLVYSFKALAHVVEVGEAVAEMVRVARKGGYLIPEFYNRTSVRLLVRALKGRRRISPGSTDRDVYTRYDSWKDILDRVPAACRLEEVVGVRIWTIAPAVLRIPLLRRLVLGLERLSSRGPLKRFAGFVILVLKRVS